MLGNIEFLEVKSWGQISVRKCRREIELFEGQLQICVLQNLDDTVSQVLCLPAVLDKVHVKPTNPHVHACYENRVILFSVSVGLRFGF